MAADGTKYRVNSIFHTVQGEGYWSGHAAAFVRFAGCNLACPFCDTEYNTGTEMSDTAIVEAVTGWPTGHVVLTGGEPCLQLREPLVRALHNVGMFVQIETNGTVDLPANVLRLVDWVTCSPKSDTVLNPSGLPGEITIGRIDELKVIKTETSDPRFYEPVLNQYGCGLAYIQPCDTGDAERNRKINEICVDFVKKNPKWKISLQIQKILNVQ